MDMFTTLPWPSVFFIEIPFVLLSAPRPHLPPIRDELLECRRPDPWADPGNKMTFQIIGENPQLLIRMNPKPL